MCPAYMNTSSVYYNCTEITQAFTHLHQWTMAPITSNMTHHITISHPHPPHHLVNNFALLEDEWPVECLEASILSVQQQPKPSATSSLLLSNKCSYVLGKAVWHVYFCPQNAVFGQESPLPSLPDQPINLSVSIQALTKPQFSREAHDITVTIWQGRASLHIPRHCRTPLFRLTSFGPYKIQRRCYIERLSIYWPARNNSTRQPESYQQI